MILDNRSLINLNGLHDHLIAVVGRAAEITDLDFIVTEGLRTEKRQAELFAAGASQTMNSRHLTGHAVDLAAKVGKEVRWDWPLYAKLNEVMQEAAAEMGVPLEWGGNWKKFKDGPHWQLPHKEYPA
jgi:peptidoglycan L-alanyl-D-glutamate endopeptidase CwlK